MGECVHHGRFEDHIKESDKYRDKIILNESEINHMREDVKDMKNIQRSMLTRVAFTVGGINVLGLVAMVLLK